MTTTPKPATDAVPGADITYPEVTINRYRPNDPCVGRLVRSEVCTASPKAASFCRHLEIDVSGTDLDGIVVPGQSIGVLAPGEDAKGRPHQVRLYSVCSPTRGEDGQGHVIATTVKRTIDEHWDNHTLFTGVASNFLCDLQEGDEVRLTGPSGKRFLLPSNPGDHDYLFFATGTGIAPFRGFVIDLLESDAKSEVCLVMGSPYASDLLYHDFFLELASKHDNFTYLTAMSREKQADGHDPMYVQGRLVTDRDRLMGLLKRERTLMYVCGIAGMEMGILQELARELPKSALEQYLRADAETISDIDGWSRKMLHRQIKTTKRVHLEVYA